MNDFSQPTDVSDALAAFPSNVAHLMPKYKDIPEQFRRGDDPWTLWQQEWFFKGLKKRPIPKENIDLEKAILHLHCIQASYQPKHEHKQAAVAYLASLWFKSP